MWHVTRIKTNETLKFKEWSRASTNNQEISWWEKKFRIIRGHSKYLLSQEEYRLELDHTYRMDRWMGSEKIGISYCNDSENEKLSFRTGPPRFAAETSTSQLFPCMYVSIYVKMAGHAPTETWELSFLDIYIIKYNKCIYINDNILRNEIKITLWDVY